ncbi:zinc-dependent endopolyphosphatase [Trichomonascus vanleenenianus]|uniref:putative serine/threonine-protein phosphatase n=1 Tax=Trichomonascus vanleenenianus TaxID=2268995 RepID=UPI003EC98BBD
MNNGYGIYQPLQYSEAKKPRRGKMLLMVLGTLIALFPVAYLMVYYIPMHSVAPVPEVVTVKDLDRYDAEKNGKLVLVGDVHGQYEELKHLLKKADFDEKKDHLVLLGDFLTKGTGSIEVLEHAIKIGASCVRGNHEHEILNIYAQIHGMPADGDDKDWVDDAKDRDLALARKLKPKHVNYLTSCPAILRLGKVTELGVNGVACHGGLQWHISELEDQDPEVVWTIRTLLPPDYKTPAEDRDGEPWAEKWNEHQKTLPFDKRQVVFYGHDAGNGLTLRKYTKGLDSACVRGERLSSIVISGVPGDYKEELVSVACKEP